MKTMPNENMIEADKRWKERQASYMPGPWFEQTVNTKGGFKVQILGDKGVVIADMPIQFAHLPEEPHATWDHQKTNARLIAAAPELLVALQISTKFLLLEAEGHRLRGDKGKAESCEGQAELNAQAIAKATGQ